MAITSPQLCLYLLRPLKKIVKKDVFTVAGQSSHLELADFAGRLRVLGNVCLVGVFVTTVKLGIFLLTIGCTGAAAQSAPLPSVTVQPAASRTVTEAGDLSAGSLQLIKSMSLLECPALSRSAISPKANGSNAAVQNLMTNSVGSHRIKSVKRVCVGHRCRHRCTAGSSESIDGPPTAARRAASRRSYAPSGQLV